MRAPAENQFQQNECADSVQVQLDLPDMLAALADRISGRLKQEGQKLLEKR